jgi:hypothetical protein
MREFPESGIAIFTKRCAVTNSRSDWLDLHGSARYRIVVQGRLDAAWVEQIDGLQWRSDAGPPAQTVLWGRLRDQAELHGLLRTLYNLGLPLIAVALLRPGEEDNASGS